tara:strand:+ start:1586 stop:4726 length:3141 start_codon:yes stop_codon:yes gene_type:complete
MALFQTSVLKKYLTQQDANVVSKAYHKYAKYFLNPEIQENIRTSNEEQFQATFLTELFVNVLDYTINPSPKYNLTTEYKNEKNNRKADGAILNDGATVAVVELKGTNTKDLESIRKQAFDYKVNHKGCRFVITSNFEKLRLYIDDATEHLAFDLFQLTEADFSLLYLCLHKDNLLKTIPLKIKQDSLIVEEQITKDFYKDYSLFKRELYRDLVKKNGKVLKVALQNDTGIPDDENHQNDLERLEKNVKLTLFKKSQKLIDRFLFIFFAEDRGLLQPNYTLKRLAEWDTIRKLDVDEPLYDRFKKHFNYLDKGRKGDADNKEIFAYNGGLFKPDSILDRVLIDDELLYKHTKKLATYDFESQVDVNILGHIFENSLNEIESINAEIEGGDFDKQKSKRKKDGVFYTPKYITKYIVENTVGKLCDEKKAALGFQEEEYFKGRGTGRNKRNDKTIQKLVTILDDYRDWLLQITICDPACGSGAFLNQALDFLIKEHQYIDELKTKILGGGLQFPDIENTILENNIYGVDLNEESVEIAKLSLWLRTAQPRRKLNDLSSNIKCGNSLIDSKSVAGDKAFHWETAFAKVFENGGFDVVIGNPPYVFGGGLGITKEHKRQFKKQYVSGSGKVNLFTLFVEKGIKLLKIDGRISYIIPNTFLRVTSYSHIRKYVLENTQLTDVMDLGAGIFDDAVTSAIIFVSKNRKPERNSQTNILKDFIGDITPVSQQHFIDSDFLITTNVTEAQLQLLSKMDDEIIPLGHLCKELIFGVVISGNKDELVVNEPLTGFKPFLEGKDIGRYTIKPIHSYLDYKPNKIHRSRTPEIFDCDEKLLIQRITGGSRPLKVAYDNNQFYNKESINNLILKDDCPYGIKAILAILNSRLISWYYSVRFTNESTLTVNLSKEYLSKIPVSVNILNNQEEIIEFAEGMLEKSRDMSLQITKLQTFFVQKYALESVSNKLENWQDLDFGDFIKELNKAIKATNKQRDKDGLAPIATLTKTDEFEWLDLFEQNKKKAQDLQLQINTIEQQIDAMVYELYGLSDDEIRIVEGS